MSAKRKEADEQIKLAEKHLTKSMFRWQPDYMLAAPCLEKAADAYRSAKEYDLAKRTYLRAASVQEKNKSSFRAAQNTENAAKVIMQMLKENPSISVESSRHVMEVKDCYEVVSNHFVEMGELGKAADALVKGASFCEEKNLSTEIIKNMYTNACSLLETQGKPHFAIETFRKTIGYLVRIGELSDATKLVQRQVSLFQEIDQISNVYKGHLSYVILQLARGDVAAADTYYMAQLQDDGFLHSDECAVTEDLVRAFKLGNAELLQTTLKKQTIHFIDHQIGKLARTLKLYGSTTNSATVAQAGMSTKGLTSTHATSTTSEIRKVQPSTTEFDYDALELADGSVVRENLPPSNVADADAPSSATGMVEGTFDLT